MLFKFGLPRLSRLIPRILTELNQHRGVPDECRNAQPGSGAVGRRAVHFAPGGPVTKCCRVSTESCLCANPWTQDQIQRLDDASMKILEEVGRHIPRRNRTGRLAQGRRQGARRTGLSRPWPRTRADRAQFPPEITYHCAQPRQRTWPLGGEPVDVCADDRSPISSGISTMSAAMPTLEDLSMFHKLSAYAHPRCIPARII
jgi:trimethylamine--corrinoid protein Co-methyltransferase